MSRESSRPTWHRSQPSRESSLTMFSIVVHHVRSRRDRVMSRLSPCSGRLTPCSGGRKPCSHGLQPCSRRACTMFRAAECMFRRTKTMFAGMKTMFRSAATMFRGVVHHVRARRNLVTECRECSFGRKPCSWEAHTMFSGAEGMFRRIDTWSVRRRTGDECDQLLAASTNAG